MILILINNPVLAEKPQHCPHRSSGSEKRCLTGRKEVKASKIAKKVSAQSQNKEKAPTIAPTLKNTKNNLSNSKSYVLQLLQQLAAQRAIPSITPVNGQQN